MPGRAAAQGARAVVTQVVPATLCTIGDLQRAGRRHRQDGEDIVVAAVVNQHRDAGGVCHLQQLRRRAEIERPATAGGERLAKAQLAARVIDAADRGIAAIERTAAVADGDAVRGEAQTAGGDGVARMQHARIVEGVVGGEHRFALGRVKDELALPGGSVIRQRRFDLRGGDEFFHDARQADGLRVGADGLDQRLDAIVRGAVGDVRLHQQTRWVGVGDGRIIGADKIRGERGRGLHLDHGAHKILAVRRGKGAVLGADADNLHVLLLGGVALFDLAQAIDVADQRQGLIGALIRLDDA